MSGVLYIPKNGILGNLPGQLVACGRLRKRDFVGSSADKRICNFRNVVYGLALRPALESRS
jgi:hypothetical protein